MPKLSNQSRDLAKGLAFLSPWIVGFSLFTALPVGLSFYYSFCNYTLLQKPVYVGMDNYREMAVDPIFWITIRNTAVYAVASLTIGTIAAIAAAVLLNCKIRGQSIYRTIIFLPSLIPAVASAMLWLWLFNAKLGLINDALRGLGIVNPPAWLNDTHWAMPALILISLWGIGNSVVIYLAGLQDVPRELYEAADVDGASPLRKLWHVTLPGISPVIFFNVIMGLIGTMQVFVIPYIVTEGGPERSTDFISMYLYENAFHYLKMGQASALAWVQLLIILALTAITTWSSKHWVHHSGK
jgi:multiple sugar transport system permease protein